jgi:hypothetical protein
MVQRGYRALVLWTVWAAAAIAIYFGMYQDTEVWAFVAHDPSRITWAILGLFGVGVATSFILTVLLTLESAKVDELEYTVKKSGWLGIEGIDKRWCIANFFNSLKTIVDTNGELDIESLVDVEFAVYQRAAQALEIIGNLLITLGLVGTVVGLTLTLTGLTGSLEALGQDQDQLLAGLREAMSGMGTAFYTTLLGSVLGGVLLRIFAHIDENGVESLENALTRICIVYCAADIKPSLQRDVAVISSHVQALTQNIAALQRALADSRQSVNALAQEMKQTGGSDDELARLRELIKLRREYIETLQHEFVLKRADRGVLGWLFGTLRR